MSDEIERTQPKHCIREAMTYDAPPNCWCDGCQAFELQRVKEFERRLHGE